MQGDSSQKAGKGAINPRRKSLHLNALDSFLPSQTNRENLVHSRDEGDISFRKSEMSALPLKADVLGLSTEVRYVPIADNVSLCSRADVSQRKAFEEKRTVCAGEHV